jgi:O-antigen ligase
VYSGKKLTIWVFGISAYLMLMALMMTISKGPIISLMCGVAILVLLVPRLRKHYLLYWVLIVFIVISSFFVSRLPKGDYAKALDYTTETSTDSSQETTSIGSRIIRWKKGARALAHTKGLGTGSGGFLPAIENFFVFDSLYVHIIVEYGVIGTLLWLWFFFLLLKKLLRAYRTCQDPEKLQWLQLYAAGLATLLLNGVTSENQIFLPVWFYLGIGQALANSVTENKKIYFHPQVT